MSDFKITATDIANAKDDPTYNPGYDATDLGLYKLMTANEDSQAVTDQYTRAFVSMITNTNNLYEGVLENPHKCDLADISSRLGDIKNHLSDLYNNGYTNMNSTNSDNPNWLHNEDNPNSDNQFWLHNNDNPNYKDNPNWLPNNDNPNYKNNPNWNPKDDPNWVANKDNPNWISNMDPKNTDGIYYQLFNNSDSNGFGDTTDNSLSGDDIIFDTSTASISSGTNTIQTYTDGTVANIASIMAMVTSALAIASALGNILNPCLGIGDFFKTLTSYGKKLVSTIKKYVNKIKNLIESGIDYALAKIRSLVSEALRYVKSGLNYIKSEIKKLIKSLKMSLKIGVSDFLKGLSHNPCAKSLLSTITTGAAQALL